MLVNEQVIISEKDRKRQCRQKQQTLLSHFSKITIEDIFFWIKKAYLMIKDDSKLIKNAFVSAGYIDNDVMEEEILKKEDSMEIENEEEVEGDLSYIPIDDSQLEEEDEEDEDLLNDSFEFNDIEEIEF